MYKDYNYIENRNGKFVSWYIDGSADLITTNPSETIDIRGLNTINWEVLTDATSSNVTVKLDGSLDGTNWTPLMSWTGTGNSDIQVEGSKNVEYIRFRMTSTGDATSIIAQYYVTRA